MSHCLYDPQAKESYITADFESELEDNKDLIDATARQQLCCFLGAILGIIGLFHLFVRAICVFFERNLPWFIVKVTRPLFIVAFWITFILTCYVSYSEAND